MPTETIKIQVNADDLDAKLSKSMKELGLHHDQYGRLINKEGQFVAGLSQANIRMGYYIDSQGKMRDAQGRLVEGLTATQRALRFYKDELGNVYTAEGELVKAVEEANQAIESQGNTLQENQQVSSALQGSLSAFGGALGSLSQVTALLGTVNGQVGDAAKKFAIVTQAVQMFATTASAVQGIKTAMMGLTAATNAQSMAQTVLNALSGNWVAIAAGAAAAGTAVYALTNTVEKSTEAVTNQIPEVEALTAALKKCCLEMKSLSAEQAGFMDLTGSELDGLNKATKALEDYDKKTEQALQRFQNYQKEHALQDEGFWKLRNEYEGLRAHRDDQKAAIALEINKMMLKDLPKDELTALKERAGYYAEVINSGALEGEALARAKQALSNNLEEQNKIINKENQNLEEEAKRAERARAETLGYGDFIKDDKQRILEPTTKDELDAAIKKAAQDLGEGSELYIKAVGGLKASYEKFQAEPYEKFLAEQDRQRILEPTTKYELDVAIKKAAQDLGEGSELYIKAVDGLKASYEKFQAEQEEQRLATSQSYLDSLRESAKTAEERYRDEMQKLNEARELNGGILEDYDKLAKVLYKKYHKEESENGNKIEEQERYKGPDSLVKGSQQLYEVLTQRENNEWKNEVKTVLTAMKENGAESKDYLEDIKDLMDSMNRSTGVV